MPNPIALRPPKRPHLPFVPTEEQRGFVRVMASAQIPVPIIAAHIVNPETKRAISPTTLQRKFRHDLDNGHLMVKAFAVNQLFQLMNAGNVAAVIFYLKTQCGWHSAARPGIEGEFGSSTNGGAPARGSVLDVTPEQIPNDPQAASRIYQQLVQAG